MAVLCTLPAQKFLPVCRPQVIKSRFSLLVVFRILCFTKLRFLQLQKRCFTKVQKFLDFGGFAPSPARRTRAVTGVARTPSATLCAFQVSKYFSKFWFLVSEKLSYGSFWIEFQALFIADFFLIFKNRYLHLLCKASLRIPTPCPCFIYHFEHNLSGTSGICIFSSKLITYCAVVRVV